MLADKLNMAGLAVAEIIEKKPEFTGVVVAKVLKVDKHPNADNLSLCEVDNGKEILKVVCGAPNVKQGQTVPLALAGAELPCGINIKQSKIRGIESNGMICSSVELGLGNDASGILVLDEKKYIPGQEFKASEPDTILNLEITPNRPDLLCMTGIARFISSILNIPFSMPDCAVKTLNIDAKYDINKNLKVEILSSKKCPRYTARIIAGLKVSESPGWLKDRLTASNIRPVNNIVDITNYVMLELNQPLHAFDYSKIKGSKITVRTAAAKEKIKALDGKLYELDTADLVIADDGGPIAIAGVMGGENFSISPDTVAVVLESAYFNPASIRKTSRTLGLMSESSYRFERGIDMDSVDIALNRASQLIAEICGGKVSSNYIDVYPGKHEPRTITFRYDRLNKILGLNLENGKIKSIIEALHFKINKETINGMEIIIPGYRPDMSQEIDVIEDVAEIYGYNNITTTLPCSKISVGSDTPENIFNNNISNIMAGCGFNSIVNYSFLNNKFLKSINFDPTYLSKDAIPLKNPFNDEETHMKTTLIPDLIRSLVTNYNNENENIHLFEIANIFNKSNSGYSQSPMLAAISYGFLVEPAFNHNQLKTDFFYLKSVIDAIYNYIKTDRYIRFDVSREIPRYFEYSSDIIIGDTNIGVIGQLSQEILYANKFKDKAFLFEIKLDLLKKFIEKNIKYKKISSFPVIKRDLSLIVKDDIPQINVEHIINKEHKQLIKSLRLYDLYKAEQVPAGCKSLTYSIIFQSDKKTLSEIEINKVMERIITNLKSEINAELRS